MVVPPCRETRLRILFLILYAISLSGLRAQEQHAEIQIDATRVENEIPKMLYGQFVEDFFGGVEGPLWAELIRDRGFEEAPNAIGLPRYWEREPDDRNHDPAMRIKWDSSISYPPQSRTDSSSGHSLSFEISPVQWDPRQRRGISQARIAVRAGIAYHGYLWIKTEGFDGYITTALEEDRIGGRTYASQDLPVGNHDWTKYEFRLTPGIVDPHAKFSILFHGKGRIWIDQVSLMPEDAVDGARREVYEKIKELRPSFIRWPGGNAAQNYHWQGGVGGRDLRLSWSDHAWWNEINSYDFGTDEFLRLCRDLGTEPSITVNVEGDGATAEEAADWVQYVNGPSTSKYGRLRADNGHPEPYHVKYWEIGNEVFGPWEIGHSDAATYASNLNRYVAAMKAVDPDILVIACGSEDLAWNRELLDIAGKNIDFLAIHHYYGIDQAHGDTGNLLAHPLSYGQLYSQLRTMIRERVPGKRIRLSINEWNTALPMPSQESMLAALYAARMMNQFERNGDLITMSAISDLVNGWSGGIIQSSAEDRMYVTPSYLVNQLYNDHLGTERLSAEIKGPTFQTSLEGNAVPYLDAIVSRSEDGKRIFVKAVNTDLAKPLTVTVQVKGVHAAHQAELDFISAESPDVGNDFATPEAIRIQRSTLEAGDIFQVELKNDSVSVITLQVVPGTE